MPSQNGTNLSFIRSILKDEKKVLYSKDIVTIHVPLYPEISVKSLYQEAVNDPVVSMYLP